MGMSSLTVVALDIKGSHEKNSNCPMRIAPHPSGNHWYCVDCGIAILAKRVEADTESGFLESETNDTTEDF